MATNYTELLMKLCNTEAMELQHKQGLPKKGIPSSQVQAVIIVLARILAVLQMDDALTEIPK